jgi:hypothetical protein
MAADARSFLTDGARVVKPLERIGRAVAVDAAVVRQNRHHLREDREWILDGSLPVERPRDRESAEEHGDVQSIVHGCEIECPADRVGDCDGALWSNAVTVSSSPRPCCVARPIEDELAR